MARIRDLDGNYVDLELGELTLRRIGPFPFSFDSTLDVDDSWHTLIAFDPGIIIVRAWAVFDEDFDVAEQAIAVSMLSGTAPHNRSLVMARYTAAAGFTANDYINDFWEAEPAQKGESMVDTSFGSYNAPILTTKLNALLVASYEQPTPTEGACRVYCIVAEPAA